MTALDAWLADDLHPGWAQGGAGERPRLCFVFADSASTAATMWPRSRVIAGGRGGAGEGEG